MTTLDAWRFRAIEVPGALCVSYHTKAMEPQHSIGKEKAISLFESNWWEGKSHREIAEFQLFTSELCVPFGIFHEALEKTLGRPVWTHELALNYDGLVKEFLGENSRPTMQQIINLIPEDKRIRVFI